MHEVMHVHLSLLAIVLSIGCAGKTTPPESLPPGDGTGQNSPAQNSVDQPQHVGQNVWEAIPDAPHGQCCTADDGCGPITCEPYEYATPNCQKVCTYSCQPGDTCPALGGTLDPPPPCPESGLCPVGAPWW